MTAFLRTRMEKTVRFCDKTITVTKNNINQTEEELNKKTAPSNFKEVKDEVTKNMEGYSAQLIQKKDRKYHNFKYRGNRRALNRNTHINSANNNIANIQPIPTLPMQSKPSFSQVVQIPQPSTQSKPPARKKTENLKKAQGQGKLAPFQESAAFNFGNQPQQPVKQTAANILQNQSGFNEPQSSNRFSKKRSCNPCTSRGNEHHIHEHHAKTISHSRGNNRIRKFFRQNYSGNTMEEER